MSNVTQVKLHMYSNKIEAYTPGLSQNALKITQLPRIPFKALPGFGIAFFSKTLRCFSDRSLKPLFFLIEKEIFLRFTIKGSELWFEGNHL